MDATAMAHAVAGGEIHPRELLECAIERIEATNPALNAVVHTMYERARDRVDSLPDGPLRGVPFLVKDLKMRMEGIPTSDGTRLMHGRVREGHSELARRYEAAGLQILGKTNTPEFGIMGITEPELFGPCRNPWNPEHTPGGSSGGAAAAVASGMVPVAHGGDGGGSIRIPASCCGLFGLKPTRGRVTMAPFLGEAWGGFVQEHVLARSVRDSALLLDVADPPTVGEPYGVPPKARPWVDEVGVDPGRLRIAVCREALYAGQTHPDCLAALDDAVSLLTDLGHEVIEQRPRFDRAELVRAYFLTVATGVAGFVRTTCETAGVRRSARHFEPATWLLASIGEATSAPDLLAAQVAMHRAGREVGAFFETVDLFMTPTLARPPARIGELAIQPAERLQMGLLARLPLQALLDLALEKMGEGKLSYTPNTQLFNQTGQPAMSVPLWTTDGGLPIGTQFAARFGDEATLLRLAAQLEAARPWTLPAPRARS